MKTKLLFTLALWTIFLNGCDFLDDSPCGVHETYDLYILGEAAIVDTSTGIYYSYTEGGNRVFQWSNIVEGVCSMEHVKASSRIALLDESTTGINARSRIDWLFLFEQQIPMTKNGSDIMGSGEAGLKQAFDSGEGWFIPIIEVYFPTKGSYSADTAFLKQSVISVEMMAKYRKF